MRDSLQSFSKNGTSASFCRSLRACERGEEVLLRDWEMLHNAVLAVGDVCFSSELFVCSSYYSCSSDGFVVVSSSYSHYHYDS